MNGSLVEVAFAYVIKNEKRLRNLMRVMAHGDPQLADEMYSDVVLERIVRLFELWDGDRPIDNYVMKNLKWYAYKFRNKQRKDPEVSEHVAARPQEMGDILDGLDDWQRYFIEANVFYKMTISEIANDCGLSISKVSRGVSNAKERLAELWQEN